MSNEMTVAQLAEWLRSWLDEARKLNANDSPERSRELSLAITNAEQALHWITAKAG
jgi:hypothetical protein